MPKKLIPSFHQRIVAPFVHNYFKLLYFSLLNCIFSVINLLLFVSCLLLCVCIATCMVYATDELELELELELVEFVKEL